MKIILMKNRKFSIKEKDFEIFEKAIRQFCRYMTDLSVFISRLWQYTSGKITPDCPCSFCVQPHDSTFPTSSRILLSPPAPCVLSYVGS